MMSTSFTLFKSIEVVSDQFKIILKREIPVINSESGDVDYRKNILILNI